MSKIFLSWSGDSIKPEYHLGFSFSEVEYCRLSNFNAF